jgi:DNA-directed RNA polymerase specialized sigma24 family protein
MTDMTERLEATADDLLQDRDWLNRLAHSLVRDPHTAEDATQQTWLQSLRGHRPVRDGRAWLATVLGNVVRQGRRSPPRISQESGVGAGQVRESKACGPANGVCHVGTSFNLGQTIPCENGSVDRLIGFP